MKKRAKFIRRVWTAEEIEYVKEHYPNRSTQAIANHLNRTVRKVSFHSPWRDAGPDYAGKFDGAHKSADRIIAFCDSVLRAPDLRQMKLDPDEARP